MVAIKNSNDLREWHQGMSQRAKFPATMALLLRGLGDAAAEPPD
jgi:hypothetical protein